MSPWKTCLLSQLREYANDTDSVQTEGWDECRIVKAIYALRSGIAQTLSDPVIDEYVSLECSALEKDLMCTNILKERAASNLVDTAELVELFSALDIVGFVEANGREFMVISKDFLHEKTRRAGHPR